MVARVHGNKVKETRTRSRFRIDVVQFIMNYAGVCTSVKIFVCVCVCVCACVKREREREREKGKGGGVKEYMYV